MCVCIYVCTVLCECVVLLCMWTFEGALKFELARAGRAGRSRIKLVRFLSSFPSPLSSIHLPVAAERISLYA